MAERPITLTRESVQRIQAGAQTVDVIPVTPTPKRLDDAFDGTLARSCGTPVWATRT